MGLIFGRSFDMDDFGPIEHDFKCLSCKVAIIGRGRYQYGNKALTYYCYPCIQELQKNTTGKPTTVRLVSVDEYKAMIKEAQE